jgi:hypothetical protein
LFKQSCLQLLGIGATPLILAIYYGTYTSFIFDQWQREEYMGIIFSSPLSERYHPRPIYYHRKKKTEASRPRPRPQYQT